MANNTTTVDMINNSILEYNVYLEEITGEIVGYYTPQINSFTTLKKPINISDSNLRSRVRALQNVPAKYFEGELDNSLINDLAIFFNSKNIALEEKNHFSNKLSQSNQELVYKRFLELYNQQLGSNFYKPKYNNIPIDNEYVFTDLQDILLGKEKIQNIMDIIVLKLFIDSCEYFKIDGLPATPRYYKELLSKSSYIEIFNKYFEKIDNTRLIEIKESKTKHSYEINKEIKEYILNSMPQGLNTLEQSIYIYAKLCKILDYDTSYYNNNKSDSFLAEEKVEEVNLANNNVVCYTFSYILSGLLREIGIEHIEEQPLTNNMFSNKHAFITYIVEDISIMADSTHKGAETGDLTGLKVENRINELRCTQHNLNNQEIVNNAKRKIESILEYESTKEQYPLPSPEDISKMNDIEKYILFNNIVANTQLTGVSLLGYLIILKERLKCHIQVCLEEKKDINNLTALIRINPFGFTDIYKIHTIEYRVDLHTKEITYNSNNVTMKI